MKIKSTTQLPNKSKEKGIKLPIKSLTQKEYDQERFEEELLKINLKKPKNAFNFFIMEMRAKNKIKGSITKSASEFARLYQSLPNSQLEKFEELAEKDKQRYKEHMNLVKKFIIEKPPKEKSTAYSIFIDEKLREARERASKEDPKEVRKTAKAQWEDMLPEQRKAYEDKKEQHLKFYQELKDSNKRVNAFSLFYQDLAKAADAKGEKILLKDVTEKWNKTSDAVKDRYVAYAQETLNEREQTKKLYMLAYGIKPKLPKSAYKIFFSEKIKEGILGINIYSEAKALWEKLSDDQKDIYLRKAQKEKLVYELIKREYLQNNRKARGPSAFNLFMRDLKGSEKSEFSQIGFFNFAYKKWQLLDMVYKNKYEKASKEMRIKINEEYEEKLKAEKNQAPKRALSAYNIYLKEKMPEFKKKYPKKEQSEIFQLIGQEFANVSAKERKIYDEKAKKSKEEFEKFKKEAEEINQAANKDKNIKSKKGKSKEESSDEENEDLDSKRKNNKNANKKRSRTIAKNSKSTINKTSASEEKIKNEEDDETTNEEKKDANKKSKNTVAKFKGKNAKYSEEESENDESFRSEVNRQKKGKVTKQSEQELSSKLKAGKGVKGVKGGK